MTRIELTKPNREKLATDYNLRVKIGIDIGKNERTIQRWATGNSPQLTTDSFLAYFKKHTNWIEPLTKEVKVKTLLDH